jgi:cell division protein FtsB
MSFAQKRLYWETVIFFLLFAALVWTRFYLPARARSITSRREEASMRADVDRLRLRLRRLESKRDALKAADRETTEEAIREELGWGRPGEVLVGSPERP